MRCASSTSGTVTVSIPGEGDVPFEVGTKDDVEVFVASLASATS